MHKNILIVIFIISGIYIVLDFRDHNFKRATDACVAGSQKLKQEIVDSMKPYAPGISENKLQAIVKDITLDMSPEEAQASAVSNFQKMFFRQFL